MPRISLDRDGAIATVWLDRADKRNAMDGAMMTELAAAFDTIGNDRGVRVVVLRGRGVAFSSGIDHALLLEVATATRTSPFLHLHHQLQDVFHRMSRLHQPVIAALHGACVGMALELALAADIRLASPECAMGLPEVAFGLVPDVGGTTRLVRTVGEPRARELILTGRMIKAETAERYGLIHEVAVDLEARVGARAKLLASHPAAGLGLAKQLCQLAETPDAFRLEGIVQQALLGNPGELAGNFPAALAHIKAQLASPE
jgi:enoyl-CoA hydratase/carnithine racemase